MSRSSRSRRNATRVATMAAVVLLVLGAATNSRASERDLTGEAAGGEWPTFGQPATELTPPPVTATNFAVPGGEPTVVVSAPLPPAVMTGAFVLGGQWVVSLLWKKRKI